MFTSVSDFIEQKGGNSAVASATGYAKGAVGLWRHRNRLPRTAWPEIMKAYPDVTLDDLLRIEAANDDVLSERVA
jgi:hypothetical protein